MKTEFPAHYAIQVLPQTQHRNRFTRSRTALQLLRRSKKVVRASSITSILKQLSGALQKFDSVLEMSLHGSRPWIFGPH